jgi:hypothetical protein
MGGYFVVTVYKWFTVHWDDGAERRLLIKSCFPLPEFLRITDRNKANICPPTRFAVLIQPISPRWITTKSNNFSLAVQYWLLVCYRTPLYKYLKKSDTLSNINHICNFKLKYLRTKRIYFVPSHRLHLHNELVLSYDFVDVCSWSVQCSLFSTFPHSLWPPRRPFYLSRKRANTNCFGTSV